MKVKVLSIKNPFAYFIMHGMKKVENRSWETDYRGRLYIHVSSESWDGVGWPNVNNFLRDSYIRHAEDVVKDFDGEEWRPYADGFEAEEDATELEKKFHLFNFRQLRFFYPTDNKGDVNKDPYMPSKTIIGYVDMVDCIKAEESPFFDDPFAAEAGYHWIFKNPVLLDSPIRFVNGRLRLWDYDIDKD